MSYSHLSSNQLSPLSGLDVKIAIGLLGTASFGLFIKALSIPYGITCLFFDGAHLGYVFK